MPQHVHYPDLFANLRSILRFDGPHELGRETRVRSLLDHSSNGPVSTFAQFLQHLVTIVEQFPILHFHYSCFERWLELFKFLIIVSIDRRIEDVSLHFHYSSLERWLELFRFLIIINTSPFFYIFS